MKVRHVYVVSNIETARKALNAARVEGISNDDLSLIARSDIELDRIPDNRKAADTDFMPAAVKGMGLGAGTTLLAGLVATVVAPIGLTLAGVGALALAGAAIGGWSAALVGSALPDPIRQKFDDHIKRGDILVVVDGEADHLSAVDSILLQQGAERLDYEAAKIV